MERLQRQIEEVVMLAMREDLVCGDVTTEALVDESWSGEASFVVRAEGVLAGMDVARSVFLYVDQEIRMDTLMNDGARVKPDDQVAVVSGRFSSILKAERTALNFLQQLSGVATETARYVEAVRGLPVIILDTRKTTPGLRLLQKYAVRMGGGQNHRMNLGDGILIKDNHLLLLYKHGMSLRDIIAKMRAKTPPDFKIEVEVQSPEEALKAVEAGADVILLDNMKSDAIRQSVKIIKGRAEIEASGGITLANVKAVAKTGVGFISVGALTHSAKALDISLEFSAG